MVDGEMISEIHPNINLPKELGIEDDIFLGIGPIQIILQQLHLPIPLLSLQNLLHRSMYSQFYSPLLFSQPRAVDFKPQWARVLPGLVPMELFAEPKTIGGNHIWNFYVV
jgi:hypothetical protein